MNAGYYIRLFKLYEILDKGNPDIVKLYDILNESFKNRQNIIYSDKYNTYYVNSNIVKKIIEVLNSNYVITIDIIKAYLSYKNIITTDKLYLYTQKNNEYVNN